MMTDGWNPLGDAPFNACASGAAYLGFAIGCMAWV